MEFKEKLEKFNYIKWIKQYDSTPNLRPLGIYKITEKRTTHLNIYHSGSISKHKEKVNFIFVTDKYAEKHGYTDKNGIKITRS